MENSPTAKQLSKETASQIVHDTANHSTESTDVTFQETCFEAKHKDSRETSEATTSMTGSSLNERAENVETSNQQQYAITKSSDEETLDEVEVSNHHQYTETSYGGAVEEEESNQNYADSSYEEMVDELEEIDHNYNESNYDWISEISRPRSYWEERRQAWYREMLDTGSPKEDIKELLQRYIMLNFFTPTFVYRQ